MNIGDIVIINNNGLKYGVPKKHIGECGIVVQVYQIRTSHAYGIVLISYYTINHLPYYVDDESVDPYPMDLLGDELKLELIKLKLKLS